MKAPCSAAGLEPLHDRRLLQTIHVVQEEGVEVAGGHRPGDLRRPGRAGFRTDRRRAWRWRTGDSRPPRRLRAGRRVFDVVGQRDDVQAVAPGFLHADGRQDRPVGRRRVHVEVALEREEAGDVGNQGIARWSRTTGVRRQSARREPGTRRTWSDVCASRVSITSNPVCGRPAGPCRTSRFGAAGRLDSRPPFGSQPADPGASLAGRSTGRESILAVPRFPVP